MRKLIYCGLVLVMVASLVIGGCAAEEEITQVRYLGAPVGSDNFMMAALFGDAATKALGMPCGAFPGGSEANMTLIEDGDGELSYACTIHAYQAYNGLAPYDREHKKLRMLGYQSGVNLTFAVRMDSDIYAIEDLLKGYKLGVGTGGAMAEVYAVATLEAGYGITDEDIEAGGGAVAHLSYGELGSGLADRTLDCICLFTHYTKVASRHMAAEERFGIRLLPVSEEAMAKILAVYPAFASGYQEPVYKGSPEPVLCVALMAIGVTSSDLPEDLVYDIMDVLWDLDFIDKVLDTCPSFAGYCRESMLLEGTQVIPFHTGAAKWYQDHGMTLPPGAEVLP